jgi:hypothetical protein
VIQPTLPGLVRGKPPSTSGGLAGIRPSQATSNSPPPGSPQLIPLPAPSEGTSPAGSVSLAGSPKASGVPRDHPTGGVGVPLGPLNSMRRRPGQGAVIPRWDPQSPFH